MEISKIANPHVIAIRVYPLINPNYYLILPPTALRITNIYIITYLLPYIILPKIINYLY